VKLCNILVPFLICAGLAVAQQPPPAPAGEANAGSITGCLAKGSAAGEYVLTNENGQQMTLISNEDLSKHVAHKIRVNGSPTKHQEKTAFRVEKVEHLADTCK
jgi:hypothetical protein